MKPILLFLFSCFATISRGHQDSQHIYQYDNVTVRIKTGFMYEEINNVKIIGQYAALLCQKLEVTQPILLDFIHNRGDTYRGKTYSFINYGSQDYNHLSYYMIELDTSIDENIFTAIIPSEYIEDDTSFIKKTWPITGVDSANSIVVRQFGFHFDVTKTLNLLLFACEHHEDKEIEQTTDTLQSYLKHMFYLLPSVSSEKIEMALNQSHTEVAEILENKIYRELLNGSENLENASYFAQNGSIFPFFLVNNNEIILDTLSQIYTLKWIRHYGDQSLFIFEHFDQLRAYTLKWLSDLETKRSAIHQIPISQDELFNRISINWAGDDIFYISYQHTMIIHTPLRMIYLLKDDVLIDDFSDYINEHRKTNVRISN